MPLGVNILFYVNYPSVQQYCDSIINMTQTNILEVPDFRQEQIDRLKCLKNDWNQ